MSGFADRVTFWSLSDRQQSDLLYDSCLPAGAVAEAFSNLRLEGSKFSQETSPEEDHSNSTDDTAFVQSSNDVIEDMGRSLFHAAMHLRSQILSLTNRMQWPPSSNELRKPPNIPPDLFNFLAWVVNGDDGSNEAISSRNRVRITSQRAERYVTSIAEDLIHCATNGRVKTPKHVYLPMIVRNLTSNVQIVSLLNRFGHGLSNSQMQEIDTAIAEQRLQADSSKVFIPSNIVRCGQTISFCWDNNDILEETLSGMRTTHCTNGIILQRQLCGPLPQALMEMVSCHCTKGCLTQRRLCKSNQLACTDICGCIGCENKSNAEDATEAGSTLCDDGYDDDSEEEM